MPHTSPHPKISPADRENLRTLGDRLAREAESSAAQGKAELWRRLNDRQAVRPMIWITEAPWHELNVDNALTPRCEDPFLREVETRLRRELFQWEHFPADMILSPRIECPKVWHSTGFGFEVRTEGVIAQHAGGGISSSHYRPQLTEPEHLDRFRTPVVTFDREATEARFAQLTDIFDGVLPVEVTGVKSIWFTPWDRLYMLVDPTEFMIDMIDRPDFINEMVKRYVDTQLAELDQLEDLGLLSPGWDHIRVGSGGYAYTSDLPDPSAPPERPLTPADLWGCGNAQIFSEISPDMHWEFSLRHELRWLERWGMNYYGCCEPLHNKIHLLDRIPGLRKFSCSPRCDIPRARENGADAYVLSVKPNPAVMVYDHWEPDIAREQVRGLLEQTRGANTELILKDLSTVCGDLNRLKDWSRVAVEEAVTLGENT